MCKNVCQIEYRFRKPQTDFNLWEYLLSSVKGLNLLTFDLCPIKVHEVLQHFLGFYPYLIFKIIVESCNTIPLLWKVNSCTFDSYLPDSDKTENE